MEKIFKSIAASEKFLAKQGFKFNEKTAEYTHLLDDSLGASVTDWGDEVVVEIWDR